MKQLFEIKVGERVQYTDGSQGQITEVSDDPFFGSIVMVTFDPEFVPYNKDDNHIAHCILTRETLWNAQSFWDHFTAIP